MADSPGSVLALDVGAKRVGVAIASTIARLPRPYKTLTNDDSLFESIQSIVTAESVTAVVLGYPRGMQGQHTAQTDVIEGFADQLREHVGVPLYFQDEALTSRHAEAELDARGKSYNKGDIDALAATYILDDYLLEHQQESQR